ncbi:MAG: filamentous hemagglutinin N-terminal domain-containing protein [Pleurocapsa sp. MO_226.B13]|nr:filamentous hemagglutinin N-terminal domain-containing protein [Pleurocapsa sp. MO_226.B13]
MKQCLSLILFLGFGVISQSLLSSPVASQITSDGTTNTQVTQNANVAEITGGERRGSNLFHSFQDFSVPTGNQAFFNNNADNISNILSRVTGGNISNIDGLIRANGSASLFLINPAGIIFGENASLNIGGSFYSSTASSILFEEGEFSAVDNLQQPMLTINAPIGLGFRDNPAPITATGIDVNSDSTVEIGDRFKSFNLIGGEINLSRGNIIAEEGNIRLASISQAGTIEFNEDESFNISDTVNRANINLDDFGLQVISRPSGGDSGNINITAQTLSLTNRSRLNNATLGMGNAGNVNINTTDSVLINSNSAIFADTFAQGNAGNVTIKAGDTFTLEGTNTEEFTGISSSANLNENLSGNLEGSAGNISIEASNISINNGAVINSNTFGSGNAGNISFNADSLNLGNNSSIFSAVGSLESNLGATGNGGVIDIATQTLSLSDGATINAPTFGTGNAGTININASDSINISGVATFPFLENSSEEGGFSSGLFNTSEASASGSGGEITITTSTLKMSNGAIINVRSSGNSSAGNITVNADVLEVTNGSQILATAFNNGAAGNINLNISERILISGIDPDYRNRLKVLTEVFGEQEAQFFIDPVSEESGVFANTASGAQGDGGNIEIGVFTQTSDIPILDSTRFTEEITIADRGRIAVDSQGSGNSGTISVYAGELTLSDRAAILAETNATSANQSTNDININLQIADSIVLREDSLISARAFGEANGGNINIDASNGFAIAFPSQNQGSDILANAGQGNGGNVTIRSQAVFGLDEGMAFSEDGNRLNNAENDIDATGEVNGVIEIITPNTDTLQGMPQLSENPVETEQTVNRACDFDTESSSSSLILSGKGGIPKPPSLLLDSQNILIDGKYEDSTSALPQPIETSQGKIQPARGVIVTEDGSLILTAYRTNNRGDRIPEKPIGCSDVQR